MLGRGRDATLLAQVLRARVLKRARAVADVAVRRLRIVIL